jgi:DNA-binding PadR family transcriptional regulator
MLRLARVTPATVDVLRVLLDTTESTWGLRLVGQTGRPAGSIYPILARLEEGGWVSSHWDEDVKRGPRRRLYTLTSEGRQSASELVAADRKHARAAIDARSRAGDLGLA